MMEGDSPYPRFASRGKAYVYVLPCRDEDLLKVGFRLIETFREQRAMAPLVVPVSAAGHTEWYRGVHADVAALLEDIASAEGLNLSRSLTPWLRGYLEARADLLHDWSARIVDTLDWAAHNSPDDPDAERLRKVLIDTLDMFVAAGVAVEPRLPHRVIDWYANGEHRRLFD